MQDKKTDKVATIPNEPSDECYDYTKTMQPERPWLLSSDQKYVYRIMHVRRGGPGTCSADPDMERER